MYKIIIVTNNPIDFKKYDLKDVSSGATSRFAYVTKEYRDWQTASKWLADFNESDVIHRVEIFNGTSQHETGM